MLGDNKNGVLKCGHKEVQDLIMDDPRTAKFCKVLLKGSAGYVDARVEWIWFDPTGEK